MQKKSNIRKNTTGFSRQIGLGVTLVTALIASGCTTYQPSYNPTVLRNKITVTESVERLELYAGTAGLHLSARDEKSVAAFLSQYASSGQGPLYISVPSSGAPNQGAVQAQSIVQDYLGRMGMAGRNMQTGHYKVRGNAVAPVIVSYRRLTTVPIDCSQGASLTHTSNNQPYGNFGCAQTANLAALIDNPMQLLAPYGLDNAYATRRMTVIDKYNAGEVTASDTAETQEVSASESGS